MTAEASTVSTSIQNNQAEVKKEERQEPVEDNAVVSNNFSLFIDSESSEDSTPGEKGDVNSSSVADEGSTETSDKPAPASHIKDIANAVTQYDAITINEANESASPPSFGDLSYNEIGVGADSTNFVASESSSRVDKVVTSGTNNLLSAENASSPPNDTLLHDGSIDDRKSKAEWSSTPSDGNEVMLLSYGFNQDASCFMCTTTEGFRIYTCTPLFEFSRKEAPLWDHGACAIGQMIFRSHAFALVTMKERKKLMLWDALAQSYFVELRSRLEIKQVAIVTNIIAIVTEFSIILYNSDNLDPFQITETGSNPRGLCALYSSSEPAMWRLACPAIITGGIRYTSSEGIRCNHVFEAHNTALTCMVFNSDGTLLATASNTGTVVKIFVAASGQLLHEFRRGTQKHEISCIAFRADNLFLAVASSSSTVHVFKIPQSEADVESTQDGMHLKSVERDASEAKANADSHVAGLSYFGIPFLSKFTKDVSSDAASNEFSRIFAPNEARSPLQFAGNNKSFQTSPPNIVTGHSDENTASSRFQHVLSTVRDLTTSVYDSSKEAVQDTLKGVWPKYFNPSRSFAQFRLSDDYQSIDFRSPDSNIIGPLCAFAGESSNHLYLLHNNGIFYEFRFEPEHENKSVLLAATWWFAPRKNFRIQINRLDNSDGLLYATIRSHRGNETVTSEQDGEIDGGDWQLV